MTETALVLTEDEWEVLAAICEHFLFASSWVARSYSVPADLLQERDIAKRIVEAVR